MENRAVREGGGRAVSVRKKAPDEEEVNIVRGFRLLPNVTAKGCSL